MDRDRLTVRALVAAGLIALALGAAVARPATASAATPCWKTLLNDWYDGRIDNTYPIHCYKDALKHLPADVQTYSSAHDDIQRALQNAEAQLRRSGKTVTPNSPVPPNGGTTTSSTPTTTSKSGKPSKHPTTTPTRTSTLPGRDPGNGLGGVADKLNHSSPSSVPLPLIVLGALAILLVAAGGAGLLLKRRQGP